MTPNHPWLLVERRNECVPVPAEELEALRRDAERYRWITMKGAEAKEWGRTHPTMEGCPSMPPGIVCVIDKTELDAAIDAAMVKP